MAETLSGSLARAAEKAVEKVTAEPKAETAESFDEELATMAFMEFESAQTPKEKVKVLRTLFKMLR